MQYPGAGRPRFQREKIRIFGEQPLRDELSDRAFHEYGEMRGQEVLTEPFLSRRQLDAPIIREVSVDLKQAFVGRTIAKVLAEIVQTGFDLVDPATQGKIAGRRRQTRIRAVLAVSVAGWVAFNRCHGSPPAR